MAASGTGLTVLSPLLDMDVTRFALSLPLEYKHTRREGKRILRAIAAPNLPDELMHIPKRGFGMPLAEWLRGPLANLMNESLAFGTWDVEKKLNSDILAYIGLMHNKTAVDYGAGLWAVNCLRESGVLRR
jgi:asparagine synthase (glutamine-hydrolysing)